jgi:hypothetical protein
MLLLPTLLAALAAVTPAASQATATGTTSTSDAEVSASSSSATLSATPGIEPTSPYGETVAKIGGELKALWDTVSGTPWTNMTIELMTGSNQEMVHLATLGSGIDAMETAEFKFTVPEVDPPSQIYFLQL